MKPWLKSGLLAAAKLMAFFIAISVCWALIMQISLSLGLSPGWGMLTVFVIAIFSMSIATEKAKYDLEQKLQKARVRKEDT